MRERYENRGETALRGAACPARAGFTLIELMVVIGIIILLISVALPQLDKARQRARDTEVKAGINQIQRSLEQYKVDHQFYPGMNWVDLEPATNGVGLVAGPALIGGVATDQEKRNFQNPNNPDDPYFRSTYFGTNLEPIPWVPAPGGATGGTVEGGGGIDVLLSGGYLDNYPANPFLAATGGQRAQMANTFLFVVNPETGLIDVGDPTLVNWNRFLPGGAGNPTMRTRYQDYGRGYFTYIPLSPVLNPPFVFNRTPTTLQVANWNLLTDNQKLQFYKFVRGYVLIGWGHSRKIDTVAKGISQLSPEGVFNTNAKNLYGGAPGGPDFDNSLSIDLIENNIGTIIQRQLYDSGGSLPQGFGQPDPLLGPNVLNLDPGFYGAVIMVSSSRNPRS